INDVDGGILGGLQQQMLVWAGLVGKQQRAAGAYVGISFTDAVLVVGCEVVADRERRAVKFKNRVAVVLAAGVGVKRAIARGYVEIARGIHSRTGVAEPDAGFRPVWVHIENGSLRERLCVVSHDPAMIGIDVTGRRPDDIDRVVGKRQGGA